MYHSQWGTSDYSSTIQSHRVLLTHSLTFCSQFHSIQWICTFGRQVSFSPEQALVLDLQDPAAFLASAPASLRPPSATEDRAPADGCPAASANPPPTAGAARGCWHADTIMADYDAFVQNMEDLNECLGNVALER